MANKYLYIIGGSNGAGKTTASRRFLPSILKCKQWVNADEIAYGLSPLDPMSVANKAGRLMLERIQELLHNNETFAIETTLATRSYRNLVLEAQSQGYVVILVFFYLPSPQVAIDRVAHRVKTGGHYIPDDVVTRRYYRGLKNLSDIFMPIVDRWVIYEYGNGGYRQMASGHKGDVLYLNVDSMVRDNGDSYMSKLDLSMIECCNQAVLDMIREMALHDELVVLTDHEGNPIWVRAREVIEKNPDLKLENVDYTPIDVDVRQIIQSRMTQQNK